jgi:beta-aspartyl-peptidase (threonine type)
MTWRLILHGGAKDIPPDREAANRDGCLEAAAAGAAVLKAGGSALRAVEASLRVLEDDPTFNAGYGSDQNAAGEVEMDAALMDGRTLDIGAVAAITGVRHPISVARLLLREGPTLLVAEGARLFAAEAGAELCEPEDMIVKSELAASHDTVGCVALDGSGNIAAGTSTGGLSGTMVGRVGDSPLPGCGFYAENGVGGVAFSGDGESISRTLLAAAVMQELGAEMPDEAVERALLRLDRVGGEAGGIVLDRRGRFGWAHNSTHFPVAWATSDAPAARFALRKGLEDAAK